MTENPAIENLELTDAELVEVLKNHGIDRRTLMTVFGAGAAVTALGSGTASAQSSLDPIWGKTVGFEQSTSLPADHTVELHVHPGIHDDFPILSDVKHINSRQQLLVSHPLGKGVGKGSEFPLEFFFDPVGLHVEPGDVVEFVSHNHEHTVTSFHPGFGLPPRVPAGRFSSPPIMGFEDSGNHDSWFYEFTAPGVYDITCLPHLPLGMVMRIVVADSQSQLEDFGDYPDLPPVDVFDNANRVLNAPEIDDPAAIGIDGEVSWAELTL